MGSAPAGFRVVDQLLPLPTASRVHMLVPAGSRPAATAALRQFVTGSGRKGQLMAAVAVAGSRTGIAPVLLRSRATISVAEGTPAGELPDLVLGSHLAQVLGVDEVELAVRVGADRPNGKPVVQVMDSRGEVLGFAKLGWNELTRAMVAREGEVLTQLAADPPASFDLPGVIESGQWQGFELLLVQPAVTDAAVPGDSPPIEATSEISRIGGVTTSPLAESRWWQDAKARLAGADHPTLPASIAAIEKLHGEDEIALGGGHGDWTPWNMGRRDGRLVVWDWERFTSGVPVGIDLVHFAYLVALRQWKRSPAEAQAHVLESVPAQLERLGRPGAQTRLLLQLHHLEMALRFAEARAVGVETAHDLFAERLAVLVSE